MTVTCLNLALHQGNSHNVLEQVDVTHLFQWFLILQVLVIWTLSHHVASLVLHLYHPAAFLI